MAITLKYSEERYHLRHEAAKGRMDAFDRLPPEVREAVREARNPYEARRWATQRIRAGDSPTEVAERLKLRHS